MIRTEDSGYLISEHTLSFGAGEGDFWLVKTDSEGNEEWSKAFGGENDDWARSVVQAEDGGYAMVGETESYGPGKIDIWLVKVGGEGGVQYSVSATAQMHIDFLNGYYSQDVLWDYIQDYNTEPNLWATDPNGLAATLNHYISSYYFEDKKDDGCKEGTINLVMSLHNYGTPSPTLVNEGAHWVLVIGAYYEKDGMNVLDVGGVWRHDPAGTGYYYENKYIQYTDWDDDFTAVDISNSEWDGYWVHVHGSGLKLKD
ncbi:hypothetical protein AKJ37_06090 [candidate division MSBL1 archaeon SCGC-AAA259I09]|uniref:Uncharacterized protein n=3 Tax=candidate division MSBL1 TaxID=215777 RepID=A0A133UPC0_9EURY|nr:hypothetical protein AKJ36_02800 [candidate division MSBL1 archaeon SCGC-AAA259I07]KXA96068.1 hypothetical protein AKJ37_06090 [candidate division MSBL1 archaeon SCGC-AAA259I09]KXA98538.1 hypothetical protein AKJ40_04690 [candidate division MSBL1 archaeon SCGC-AAA259M10]